METNKQLFTASGQTYSEVYGMQGAEIKEQVGKEQVMRLTMNFIRKFPHSVTGLRLKKSRARMMLEALRGYRAEKGNIKVKINCFIVPEDADGLLGNFHFFYRGTEILQWCPYNDNVWEMNAGDFEGTSSTRRQRTMARESIEEFAKVVLTL